MAANDILSPELFTDSAPGNAVDAARLNNAINGATIQPGFITGQAIGTPTAADYAVFNKAGALVRATWGTIVAAVYPTGASGGTASVRTLGTGATDAAAGNDTRFGATVTGIRKSAGAGSTDAAAVPSDYALAPSQFTLAAGLATLNCALNLRFYGTLNANATLTLSNIPDGSTVELQITQDGTGSRTLTLTTAGLTQTRENGTGAITATASATSLVYISRWGTVLRICYRNAFS